MPEGAGNGDGLATLVFGDRQEIPPVAVAASQAADQDSPEGAHLVLNGSQSYSPTGDQLTYSWSGPFGSATGPTPAVVMPPGTNPVTLTVSDGLKTDSTTVEIQVFPPIAATPGVVTAVEGAPVTAAVTTFTDPDPAGAASDYVASIDWGDGAVLAGAITKGSDGTLTVGGSHTYSEEGSYAVAVTITDDDVPFNSATTHLSATVSDAALFATGVDTLSTNPVNQVLATFTDANPGAPLSDFTATVNWGDGSVTTGVVGVGSGGRFTVSGAHTYSSLGYKTITIHILDDGGSSATVVDHFLLYAPSSFVMGDLSAQVASRVTFWGAQWWKLNSLSGGTAPAAFKGYANSPGAGASASGWTTDPGNSSDPPSTVPSFISVIVSSQVTQNGSTISGDAPHVVIVETDPGYASDPGHAGTGIVVAGLR